MNPSRHLIATTTAALAAGLLASSPAAADSVIDADATARNVSAYGTTSAWSRQDSDGRYRLVVMGASRVPRDAPVRSSPIPLDPDVGPTSRGTRYVVYTRCRHPATSRGCDIYGYDVRNRTERKLTEVSGANTSEVAPSYFKGAIAFSRNGRRHGVYVARPGRRPARISTSDAHETDLSATHVIYNSGEIVIARRDGSRKRELDESYGGEEAYSTAFSPVLSRSRAFWIKGGGEYGMHDNGEPWMVSVAKLSLSSRAIINGDRAFAATEMSTIALGPSGLPELYSGEAGVALVSPFLAFAP